MHDPSADPPTRLVRALEAKRIRVEHATEAHAALARLCRLAKTPGTTLAILVLVEPTNLPDAAELVELARVYAPRSVCWMYESSPSEQVREVRDADVASWGTPEKGDETPATGEQAARPRRRAGDRPSLRIVGETAHEESHEESLGQGASGKSRVGGGVDDADGDGDDPDPEAILTDDELSMLLADDTPDPDDGGRG